MTVMELKRMVLTQMDRKDIDSDYSSESLYIRKNETSDAIIKAYDRPANVSTFVDQKDHEVWYEIAFAKITQEDKMVFIREDERERIIKKLTEEIRKDIEREEALVKAWKGVSFPTKKNGEEFAVFSKNFDGCTVATKSYAMFDFEKEITVYTRTVSGLSIADSIETYHSLSYSEGTKAGERAKNHPERVSKSSKYLVAFYQKSISDMKEDVAERIKYHEDLMAKYQQEINEIGCLNDLMESFSCMMRTFAKVHGPDLARLSRQAIQENWYTLSQ